MSLLSKMSLTIATTVAALAMTLPAHASTAPSTSLGFDWGPKAAIETANKICASGNIGEALADAPDSATLQAIALGEAARQAAAGTCKASLKAIEDARDELLKNNAKDAAVLMASYNAQKDSGGAGKGNGVKGFWVRNLGVLGYTLVETGAGEAVSPK